MSRASDAARLKAERIEGLKQQARDAYMKLGPLLERYDCGIEMASYINPEIAKLRREFNMLMDMLAEIDPSAPGTRL